MSAGRFAGRRGGLGERRRAGARGTGGGWRCGPGRLGGIGGRRQVRGRGGGAVRRPCAWLRGMARRAWRTAAGEGGAGAEPFAGLARGFAGWRGGLGERRQVSGCAGSGRVPNDHRPEGVLHVCQAGIDKRDAPPWCGARSWASVIVTRMRRSSVIATSRRLPAGGSSPRPRGRCGGGWRARNGRLPARAPGRPGGIGGRRQVREARGRGGLRGPGAPRVAARRPRPRGEARGRVPKRSLPTRCGVRPDRLAASSRRACARGRAWSERPRREIEPARSPRRGPGPRLPHLPQIADLANARDAIVPECAPTAPNL